MSALDQVQNKFQEVNALQKAAALMQWDRQVLMPKGGAAARTAHTTVLSRKAHALLTSEEMRRLVEEAERSVAPGTDEAATVRVLRREIDIQTKFPSDLVEKKAKVSSDAYEAWREAKATSDFSKLAPYYEQLFDIAREMAELRGYRDHIYDALIDLFEEGATQAMAAKMFETIKQPTIELIRDYQAGPPVDDSFLYGDWDQPRLRSFAEGITKQVGFDYNRGRLDITTNAFCTNFSMSDVRMTTRPSNTLGGILFSTMHEMGHGLYEQGSPKDWDRTPLAGGTSLGVHESQSRTWENIVGRSLPLWKRFFPGLQAEFPQLAGYDAHQFYAAINKIKPGPIRIGSDEVSYNLHILTRFELECDIVTGKLAIKDLPDAWNSKYEEYLGITPANAGDGCLQDVHWSRGMVGYFPTYSMGNLIGWQIWRVLQRDLGDTDAMIEAGEFAPILEWLQQKVYSQGKRFTPRDLVTRVTGRPMEATDFLAGMRDKYSGVLA